MSHKPSTGSPHYRPCLVLGPKPRLFSALHAGNHKNWIPLYLCFGDPWQGWGLAGFPLSSELVVTGRAGPHGSSCGPVEEVVHSRHPQGTESHREGGQREARVRGCWELHSLFTLECVVQAQLCPTLFSPMDCSPLGSSVLGTLSGPQTWTLNADLPAKVLGGMTVREKAGPPFYMPRASSSQSGTYGD